MRILYLSKSKLNYSVNAVYINGLKQNGVSVTQLQVAKGFKGYKDVFKYYLENKSDIDLIMMGYESSDLVILLKLFSRKKIIYNALCSMYERLIVSRAISPSISARSFRYWFLDFVAMRCADLTMLESGNQIEYCQKLFKISPKKFYLAWTGVDNGRFFFNPGIKKFPKFSVIFRGRFLPEAGAEYVVEAAKILEKEPGINFIIFGSGPELQKVETSIKTLKPTNLEFIIDPGPGVPNDDWIDMVRKCHLSLGQLSDHPRLDRTIPHKAYETLSLKLPYLTAANKAVLELFTDGKNCLTCVPANSTDLAQKIMWAKNHPQELAQITDNGYRLYQESLTPSKLGQKLISKIKLG